MFRFIRNFFRKLFYKKPLRIRVFVNGKIIFDVTADQLEEIVRYNGDEYSFNTDQTHIRFD